MSARVTVPVERLELASRLLGQGRLQAANHVVQEMLSAAPAPEGGAVRAWMFRESPSERWHVTMDRRSVDEYLKAFSTTEVHPLAIATREEAPAEAGEEELIERYLRDALSATTARLTGYDWNADPDGVTKQQGDAFAAADRVFADLDAAVAAHPEIELPECQTCGGTGKIEEAARTTGANQHSACVRTCDDCDGCGFAPDDDPPALATREEAPAEAGEVLQRIVRNSGGFAPEGENLRLCLVALATALRAQPQAREEAQPVPFGYWVEHPSAENPVLIRHGGFVPAGDRYKITALYTHPAPDALRVAVEALEATKALAMKYAPLSVSPKIIKAIAVLQAEQGAK